MVTDMSVSDIMLVCDISCMYVYVLSVKALSPVPTALSRKGSDRATWVI